MSLKLTTHYKRYKDQQSKKRGKRGEYREKKPSSVAWKNEQKTIFDDNRCQNFNFPVGHSENEENTVF